MRGSGQAREQVEHRHVGRSDDREVPPIECRHLHDAEPFSGRDDRGVDRTEGQIPISPDELSDSDPVWRQDRLNQVAAACQIRDETYLGTCVEPSTDEVGDLSNHELWDNERARMGLHELCAGGVMTVTNVN